MIRSKSPLVPKTIPHCHLVLVKLSGTANHTALLGSMTMGSGRWIAPSSVRSDCVATMSTSVSPLTGQKFKSLSLTHELDIETLKHGEQCSYSQCQGLLPNFPFTIQLMYRYISRVRKLGFTIRARSCYPRNFVFFRTNLGRYMYYVLEISKIIRLSFHQTMTFSHQRQKRDYFE